MIKQEKIKEVYGELFEKCNPDENGWFWSNNTIFDFCKKWDKLGFRNTLRFRPKSLKGIENNNGWIKYEDKEKINYKDSIDIVYTDKGNIYSYATYCNFATIHEFEKATHFQQLQKPNPPLF